MGLPYSKFFWGDYLNATRILSMEAKGAWMDVLCYLAESETPGQVGYNLQAWARLLGCSKSKVKKLFLEISEAKVGIFLEKNGKIFVKNNRICDDFEDYIEKKTVNSAAGKKSAKLRRKLNSINKTTSTNVGTNVGTTVERPLERNANDHPNETSTIPEARSQKLESLSKETPSGEERENDNFAEIPTKSEVLEIAKLRGIPEEHAIAFFDYYEGKQLWWNKHGRAVKWKIELKSYSEKRRIILSNEKRNGNSRTVDRNQGTTNAGKASQYAGVGRVVSNQSV